MKKIVCLLTMAIFLFTGSNVYASMPKEKDGGYRYSIFEFGLKGGVDFMTFSKFQGGDVYQSLSSKTGFVAGFAFKFEMPARGITIQPELNYISKGAKFIGEKESMAIRADYIEMPVNFQFGLDLILLRPFLSVTPYIGYSVYKNTDNIAWKDLNRFEYGIGVGGGIDIWRCQLQVKYNWNLGDFFKKAPESMEGFRHGNFRGLDLSLTIFF